MIDENREDSENLPGSTTSSYSQVIDHSSRMRIGVLIIGSSRHDGGRWGRNGDHIFKVDHLLIKSHDPMSTRLDTTSLRPRSNTNFILHYYGCDQMPQMQEDFWNQQQPLLTQTILQDTDQCIRKTNFGPTSCCRRASHEAPEIWKE